MKALALLFLLAAPVAHCQLPALPDSIPSQIGPVPVVVTSAPCGQPRSLGCFHLAQRVIMVHDSLPAVMSWKVLLHEVGHLRLADARIDFEDPMLENRVVDLWATLELQAMLTRPVRRSGTP